MIKGRPTEYKYVGVLFKWQHHHHLAIRGSIFKQWFG